MGLFTGLLAALGAAVAYGVQYVPVKQYQVFDGTTFQWFMCSGILFVGLLTSLASGDLQRGCPLPVVFGGTLWGLSNYFVLPLVKLLGIGLGFSLYHFVNLVVGYCTGRLGLFGVPRLAARFPGSLALCDSGCALILVSFGAMVFVAAQDDAEGPPPARSQLPPAMVRGIDEEYRELYHRWRQGETRGSRDPPVGTFAGTVGVSMRRGQRHFDVGGFSLHSTPMAQQPSDPARSARTASGSNPASRPEPAREDDVSGRLGYWWCSDMPRTLSDPGFPTAAAAERLLSARLGNGAISRRMCPWEKRLLGVGLALVGGGLAGVQSVPATLYNHAHPKTPTTAVVFPQCLGIWASSSAIYLAYSAAARLQGRRVPHSVIRPAYLSGCIWALGFALMIAGIRELGYSVGYTLDAVGPIVVSSLISIFYFREITGKKQLAIYWGAFSLQLGGVILITAFGGQQ